ncbi:MAG TPA: lipid-A-disaccharide synthase [Pyrinomonadaceae bacterium]|nr:lipid-A-disaccharide synthase [Pyrinomonadaceae bacterium]
MSPVTALLLSVLMTGNGESIRLMLVAGEPSGDAHAAALARALGERGAGASFEFYGATGREMRAAGVETIVNADELAIVGLLEIGGALPQFWRAYRDLKRAALERRPDAVVLVDWPDFNLPLARALRRRGLKIIYYISPQLWAWRAHRVRQIRRDVDLLLAILPFEPAWYERHGIRHVEFVGHPLAGEVRARYDRAEFCRRHHLDPARPVIALLPGSRRKELQRILPPMLDAARIVARSCADAQFVVALSPNRLPTEAEAALAAAGLTSATGAGAFRIVQHETRDALAAADAAAVASGTATLEAALIATPLVVVYKESFLNWHILGSLINTEHYGLVNLIAGYRLAPELMQNDFTGETLAREILRLLDPAHNAEARARLRDATAQLGTGGASHNAADALLRAVRRWKNDSR